MTEPDAALLIGWEEWVALPLIGLPAIKAKVDTGAKTSALHAFSVERISSDRGSPRVRFGIHPIQRRLDIEVYATADIVDERRVTSSNGDAETRIVIKTNLLVGGEAPGWPIEITLANRESMNYRMLLGREALRPGLLIDPGRSFVQGKLSRKAYAPKRIRP